MSPRALVVGGGGREHAIVAALARSPLRPTILAAPGNPGISALAELCPIPTTDVDALTALALERRVELVVVGPEVPLLAGLADRLRAAGIPCFGPSAAAALLEGSKSFAKTVMREAGVPTAASESFDALEPALAWSRARGGRVAVKADGLAAGKGVVVAGTPAEAEDAIRAFLAGALGDAGRRLVLEERLEGPEVSILAVADGRRALLLPSAQDHKRAYDGDLGPNTGGMGAVSPARLSEAEHAELGRQVIDPIVARMAARGEPFIGVLYAGVMRTREGPRVLEYNVRFGDPEAQAILPRLRSDLYELLRSAATGRLSMDALDVDPRAAVSVVMASEGYPSAPRTGDRIEGLSERDPAVFHAGTARDAAGHLVTAGGRVLAVTALGEDLASARAAAYAKVATIGWRGMHHRTDIGLAALEGR